MGRLAEIERKLMDKIEQLEQEIEASREAGELATMHIKMAMRDMIQEILGDE